MITTEFNGYKVNLVENLEDIETFRSRMTGIVGVDTETTGLDYITDHIVGVCLSTGSPQEGYYFPLRHTLHEYNLPMDVVMELTQEVINTKRTFFWQRNFDCSMLEKEGIQIPFIGSMNDVQIMAYLASNEPYPKLKEWSERLLKWTVIEYKDNNAKDWNFGTTDPSVSYVYASGDPLMTVLVGKKLWESYPLVRKIYPLDNKVLETCRIIGQTNIPLDYDMLRALTEEEEAKLRELTEKIYVLAGYRFNINSGRQKAEALSRRVTLKEKTKSGQFATSEEVLAKLNDPLADMFIEHAGLSKYVGTYLKKMADNKGKPFRINYNSVNVATGRFSSGEMKKNSWYAPFNIQNVPKVEVKMYIHRDEMLGYKLLPEPSETEDLGMAKTKSGLRKAFIPPEGYIWLTADFRSEEMLLAANFSKDPVLLKPLKEGIDLHTYVAERMFGYADPENRTNVKTMNFGVLYGMEATAMSKRLGKPREVCQQLLDLYKTTLRKLEAWKQRMIQDGRQKGFITTYFGRPRYVHQMYGDPRPGMKSFGDRTCVNHPIQGCLPSNTYLETKEGVVLFSEIIKKQQEVTNIRDVGMIPSGRGAAELFMFLFKTGDYIVCDMNHKLVNGKGKDLHESPVYSELRKKVLLSKLHRKCFPSLKTLFLAPESACTQLKLLCGTRTRVNKKDAKISAYFWNLAFTRHRFECAPLLAASLRSLGSVYGFNVVYHWHSKKYSVRFTRRSHTRYFRSWRVETKGTVATCSVRHGPMMYPAQGFENRNTGGDVMRIVLCNLYDEWFKNEDFRNNVIIALHVHDECNFYVKPAYLYKAYQIIKRIMTIHPKNFEVPLEVDMGIGYDWGSCLDFKEVTPDNKIILK